MIATCVRDCHGPSREGEPWMLFMAGREYDVDPLSPVIVHMQAPPGASPEDVRAFTEAQRKEAARVRAEKETRRAAKPEEETKNFTDFKLPMTDKG